MKIGTWKVRGRVDEVLVNLKLVLVKQKKIYRAVPEKTAGNEKGVKISPGKIGKEKIAEKLILILKEKKEKKDEMLSALPAGGSQI